jgi:hypothetical protein
MIIKKLLRLTTLLCLTILWSTGSFGLRYPVMTHAEITQCRSSEQGECSSGVYYAGTSAMVDVGSALIPPISTPRLDIAAHGVHCDQGSSLLGKPFNKCVWRTDHGSHAPKTENCVRVSKDSWELTAGSTCQTASTWALHSGAGPGGECVMFGFTSGSLLQTPFGTMDATTVANSGNRFCIKPLPPGTKCDITLPSVIDHGVMLTGTSDQKYVDGVVDCGIAPAVTIVGTPVITLSPGVVSKLSAIMQSKSNLRIQSDMSVSPTAKPGAYTSVIVVSVSPY